MGKLSMVVEIQLLQVDYIWCRDQQPMFAEISRIQQNSQLIETERI